MPATSVGVTARERFNPMSPLDYLLSVTRDSQNGPHVRLNAAAKAAPYVHPRFQRRLYVADVPRAAVSGCSKLRCYSITSSARVRKDSRIVNPRAFAVVRLTTRSNLVTRLRSAQNLIDILGRAPVQVQVVRAIGHQSGRFDVFPLWEHRRQARGERKGVDTERDQTILSSLVLLMPRKQTGFQPRSESPCWAFRRAQGRRISLRRNGRVSNSQD